MKKHVFLAALCLTIIQATIFAQVGIKAGLSFTNLNTKSTFYPQFGYEPINHPSFNSKTKPQLGFIFNINLSDAVAIRPELLLSWRGCAMNGKVKEDLGSSSNYISYEAEIDLGYLEIPLNIVAKAQLGDNELQVFGGPYFAIGIIESGIARVTVEEVDNSTGMLLSVYGDEDEFYPFDYGETFDMGITVGMGYQFGERLLFSLALTRGMTDTYLGEHPFYDSTEDKIVWRSTTFSLAFLL